MRSLTSAFAGAVTAVVLASCTSPMPNANGNPPCRSPTGEGERSSIHPISGGELSFEFRDLAPDAEGALIGVVTETSGPLFNRPPRVRAAGARPPRIYARTTICVEEWLRNEGFPESEVVVVTAGGSMQRRLTAAEARRINEEQEANIAAPGDLETLHEPLGDAVFTEGDRVAVLLEHGTFQFIDGREQVVRVAGGASGMFLVEDDGHLRNEYLENVGMRFPATVEDFREPFAGDADQS